MNGFRRIGVLLAGLAALCAAPATAGAAVSCDYSPTGKLLEIRMTQSSDLVETSVAADGTIRVRDLFAFLTCTTDPAGGIPTVTNVNVVTVSVGVGVRGTVIIDDAARYQPGVIDEPGTDEIEFFVNLRDVPGSLLSVRAGDVPATVVWGASGINMNAGAGEILPDRDITAQGVDRLDGRGGFAVPVDFRAQGGSATGGPLTIPIDLQGSSGADTLVGGEGDDRLQAFGGADVLLGEGGADVIDPGEDGDVMDGGAGRDVLDHGTRNYPSGVAVDLALTGAQQTGASGLDTIERIEDVIGTPHADQLAGGPGSNRIVAGNGPDVVRVRDGETDTVDCGAGSDEVTADAPGVDALSACETVVFPPVVAPPGGGGTPGPVPSVVIATPRPPVISGVRITPRKLAALATGPSARTGGAGARVVFTLDRPADVAFRVARRAAGRRAGGRCVAVRTANRLAPRCTRLVSLRGTFTRRGVAGANAFRFTGRLRGRALRPGAYALLSTPRADGLTGATARLRFSVAA